MEMLFLLRVCVRDLIYERDKNATRQQRPESPRPLGKGRSEGSLHGGRDGAHAKLKPNVIDSVRDSREPLRRRLTEEYMNTKQKHLSIRTSFESGF